MEKLNDISSDELRIHLYDYEIYCENFSSIVISDSLIGAVTEF